MAHRRSHRFWRKCSRPWVPRIVLHHRNPQADECSILPADGQAHHCRPRYSGCVIRRDDGCRHQCAQSGAYRFGIPPTASLPTPPVIEPTIPPTFDAQAHPSPAPPQVPPSEPEAPPEPEQPAAVSDQPQANNEVAPLQDVPSAPDHEATAQAWVNAPASTAMPLPQPGEPGFAESFQEKPEWTLTTSLSKDAETSLSILGYMVSLLLRRSNE
jgi:hypothetical protein